MSDENEPVLPGGELERALLTALWARGSATARELHDEIGGRRGTVYTTIAKVLDRLVDKGMVRRRRSGRVYTYRADARQKETHRAMARGLISQLKHGGSRPAIAALLGALEDISPELVGELEAELKARKKRRDGA